MKVIEENNNIKYKNSKTYNKNNINNNFNNNYYNFGFNPKYNSEDISRNPYLNNYSKNKKIFIPMNVLNLVSFINSQKNDTQNSILAINILTKIQPLNENSSNNNLKSIHINNINKEGEPNIHGILHQTAFGNNLKSSKKINNINNNDAFSLSFHNNNNKTNNNFDNKLKIQSTFNQNNNGLNPNLKFVHFNNIMVKKGNIFNKNITYN